jgi:RNA polymerase sigma factor (sigma-70 family)
MEAALVEGTRVTGSSTHPLGSVDTFSAWVEPHLPTMTRLAAILTSESECEDVVQDALVRAWKRRSTFDPERGSPATWLFAIVRDQARRRRTRRRESAPLTHAEQSLDPERDFDLEQAVVALPARQREAIQLHYFVGLDVKTCAEVMRCAEGTVKATLHQARARLHQELGGADDD